MAQGEDREIDAARERHLAAHIRKLIGKVCTPTPARDTGVSVADHRAWQFWIYGVATVASRLRTVIPGSAGVVQTIDELIAIVDTGRRRIRGIPRSPRPPMCPRLR